MALAVVPLMSFALGQFEANEAAGKGFQQPSQTGGAALRGRPGARRLRRPDERRVGRDRATTPTPR